MARMRSTGRVWTRQPQELVGLAENYEDAALAWLPSSPFHNVGNSPYIKSWTQQGAPSVNLDPNGLGYYSGTYASNIRFTSGSANPNTENWAGVTVVAKIRARDIASNQFPSVVAWMPSGEFHGGFHLSLERDSSARYVIYWRAGDSTAQLTPTTYNAAPSSSQYAPGDDLTVVAGWDRATIWLVVNQNGLLLSNSNAHSVGWRNSSSLFSLLGYERPASNYRTSPHALNAVVVLPRSVRSDAESLACNPWQLFEPRRIWVPVASGAPSSFVPSWARNANTVLVGGRL